MLNLRDLLLTALFLVTQVSARPGQDDFAVSLPKGVRPVWNINRASREATTTRERVCLNGLWRWQPAAEFTGKVPVEKWGYFKVPGSWPGIADYMQKDCQTLHAHPAWRDQELRAVTTAWYEREFTVPAEWNRRRIFLSLEYLNSFATVWVDGTNAGEIRFPGGGLDLTALCRPGATHLLSIAVVAMPLKGVMLSYNDTFGARRIQGTVQRRGLCGDVWLLALPEGARLLDVKISTSVREWEIALEAGLHDLKAGSRYALRARVTDHGEKVKEFTSKPFTAAELKRGRFSFVSGWKPEKLWDSHTPQNIYEVTLSLLGESGQVLDTALPERFGFREFWIEGRDFLLNGSRIFLSAVPLDNAQIGAAWATYEGTRESLQRLKSFGINFVYTHNYGCEPGTHLSFSDVLRAADDEGMLVSFSQPHFGQYEWKAADADRTNGYATHAEFFVRAAQNHPSVVTYSMSHNAVGTEESMNPDQIDGLHDTRNQWSSNNVKLALRAEAIVSQLDPTRIVYHHSSGNLGSMHTANFYANFVPIQEMSDWFGHWSLDGIKPLFLCEFGVPLSWDWMMYRGWYNGVRDFGSAAVPWELCMAEWNAQFFGDTAYQLTDLEKECLRWEAARFREGRLWHRWDYPRNAAGSSDFEQRNAILAMYLTDNLRAFRTWGVSAFCPWDHGIFWKLRESSNRSRQLLPVNWDTLQKPGFSPDYINQQMEWMNTSFDRADWIPTAGAEALCRNNGPLLAYLAGKPAAFTSKDHNFTPAETVEKQIVVINNSRQKVTADCRWTFALPKPVSGSKRVEVETGQQARVPLSHRLAADTPPGHYELASTIRFSTGEAQHDSLGIDVLPPLEGNPASPRIAVFDPKGQTTSHLLSLGAHAVSVNADTDLSGYDILVIGKEALTVDRPGPDVTRVRDGMKVIVFEQTSEVLQQRFGFRVEEYGLRWVFTRVPDHPLLAGLADEHLRNWRGEATLLPPRLNYTIGSRHAPEVEWCGIPVTRLWRAGNRGNVASVLIEKPVRGDFLPIVDGGFSLQFSPLMEYCEGKGLVLFCQLDVTGRTEKDPAAEILVANLLRYAAAWMPTPRRQIVYAGDSPGKEHLEALGLSFRPYQAGNLSGNDVVVLAEGGSRHLTAEAAAIADFAKTGGHILAIGLDAAEANACLPLRLETRRAEHIAACFLPPHTDSLLKGISPAEVHNRDPRSFPLVSSGAAIMGNGVLAQATNANIVFCQIAPWLFDKSDQSNVRRTFRRTAFLTTRLLANMGASGTTPLLERFHSPVEEGEVRWLQGLYLDKPREWDDPYRFFCW